jgi:hypothetical protein
MNEPSSPGTGTLVLATFPRFNATGQRTGELQVLRREHDGKPYVQLTLARYDPATDTLEPPTLRLSLTLPQARGVAAVLTQLVDHVLAQSSVENSRPRAPAAAASGPPGGPGRPGRSEQAGGPQSHQRAPGGPGGHVRPPGRPGRPPRLGPPPPRTHQRRLTAADPTLPSARGWSTDPMLLDSL